MGIHDGLGFRILFQSLPVDLSDERPLDSIKHGWSTVLGLADLGYSFGERLRESLALLLASDLIGFLWQEGVRTEICPCGLTSRRSQPPLALMVPQPRFTSRVGGGSALVVRHRMRTLHRYMQSDFGDICFPSVGLTLHDEAG